MRFFTELLRAPRQVVGRLDGRFTGWDDGLRPRARRTTTRRSRAIIGPYTAALNHYVRAELELPERPAVRDPQRGGRTSLVVQGVREAST